MSYLEGCQFGLREKHYCLVCAKPFSRRWNKERHIRDIHSSNPFSPSSGMNFKSTKFNSHTSLHYRPHSKFYAPEGNKNLLDRSLEILRKFAEIKTLREKISPIPRRESYQGINGCFSDANKDFDLLLQPKLENLEVIGYSVYVCQNCLIAHPLRLYKEKFKPALTPIQTTHSCDMKRLVEIQDHKEDRGKVIADLYRNQLPVVMLKAVKEWTEEQTSLKAVEVSMPLDGCDIITVSNLKGWVNRAIHEGVTHLTDTELSDFISIVKDRTYAIFRIQNR